MSNGTGVGGVDRTSEPDERACMTYPRSRADDRCGKLAVLRRGVRCTNGCYGEGEFEYACADHAEYIRNMRGVGGCARCKAPVELFRAQDLVRSRG